MINRKLLKTAMAGAVALLAACGDSTGSSGSGTGSLSFSYSGVRSGSYSATGEFKGGNSNFDGKPFAVGIRAIQPTGSVLALISYQPVTSSKGNVVVFALPNISGTGSIDLTCASADFTTCAFASVIFDTDVTVEEEDGQTFLFTSGTVNVTTNSGGHLRGTFSGTAENFEGDSVITITNGTFDVPVRKDSDLSLDRSVARTTRLLERHAKPEE
ncbi:MAG TPA: hypothetical protein VFJ16_05865 [Longimicrobium sp.]|nr:hypothetical protein [Longimicrobium sp.]